MGRKEEEYKLQSQRYLQVCVQRMISGGNGLAEFYIGYWKKDGAISRLNSIVTVHYKGFFLVQNIKSDHLKEFLR